MNIVLASGIALLEINPGLVIWTTITFIIVAIILYNFAWKKIITALDQRAEYIDNNIKEAENLKKEAEAKFQEYQEKLVSLKVEAQEIIQEAKKDAERLKDEIIKKAKEEAEELRRRAQKEINLSKEAALEEIHKYAVELSMEIARKSIQKALSPEEHKRLLEETIKELNKSQN
jgi:F-type H+-transporting ATPase subunit b